jgi:hypothetical protein
MAAVNGYEAPRFSCDSCELLKSVDNPTIGASICARHSQR